MLDLTHCSPGPPPRDIVFYETVREEKINPFTQESNTLLKRFKIEEKFYPEITKYGVIAWRMETKRTLIDETLESTVTTKSKKSTISTRISNIIRTLKLLK